MRAGTRYWVATVIVAGAIAGCGDDDKKGEGGGAATGGGAAATGGEKDSASAVQNWLKSAINLDGKQYCAQMTVDLQEQATGAESDAATAKCQQSAQSSLAGELPLRISVAAEDASTQAADVEVTSEVPERLDLVREAGRFKVENVSGGGRSGETAGGRSGNSANEKQAEQTVRQWLTAAVDQDGKKYCQQLTVRYLEKLTNARSDKAKRRCERLVTSTEDTELPLEIAVVAESADPDTAEASLDAEIPEAVQLRKEGGKYKVDGVGDVAQGRGGRDDEDAGGRQNGGGGGGNRDGDRNDANDDRDRGRNENGRDGGGRDRDGRG